MLDLLLAAAMVAATPPTAVRPRLDVHVVMEPDVSLTQQDLARLSDGVRAIWRPAADVVLDVSCAVDSRTAARGARNPLLCGSQAASGSQVTLVVTNRLRRVSGPALGWVDFVDGVPQPVITVSLAEVTALMHEGRWHERSVDLMAGMVRRAFIQRALTIATAHEIGHFLLESTAHSRRGLMQSRFSVDDVMDEGSALVRLSADEIARVRQRRADLSAGNRDAADTPRP